VSGFAACCCQQWQRLWQLSQCGCKSSSVIARSLNNCQVLAATLDMWLVGFNPVLHCNLEWLKVGTVTHFAALEAAVNHNVS
jgi:hypothetical protein